MRSGEIHIIELLQENSNLKSIHLTQMMIAKWPEEVFNHALEEVALEYVVCPNSCLKQLFQISTLKRLTLIGIAESEDDLDEEIGIRELPVEIENLQNLEELELTENSLVNLPGGLRNLNKLKRLDLGWNELDQNSEFHIPISVTNLDLSSNDIVRIPKEVYDLPNLERVYLQHCQLKSQQDFQNFARLKTLDLAYNKLSIIELPQNLKTLDSLVLKGCDLSEIPNTLSNLSALERLSLEDNHILNVPSSIKELSSLLELNLSRNKINHIHEDIGKLQELEVLNVDRNDLRSIPKSIGEMENLTRLTISNNKIQQLPSALYNLSNLVTLNANWNVLSQIYPGIGKLKKLKHLNLHSCKLLFCTDEINELQNLEELTLSHNWLKKVPKLDALGKLKYLDLSGLHELEDYDKELHKLFQLNQVAEISLTHWKINHLPMQLKELKHLKRINLGQIPELNKNSQFWREEFAPIVLWF